MNRIINYIKNGRGYGLKILMLFSVLLASLIGGMSYYSLNTHLKSAAVQEFISNVPTLEIRDEKLVAPVDTYVSLAYPQLPDTFFVINTREGDLDLMNFNSVFYLTPERAYIKMGNDLQTTEYTENMLVTPEMIESVVNKIVLLMPIGFGLLLILLIWLGYGFLYLVSQVFSWLIKRPVPSDMRGRIVLLAWMDILLIDFILTLFGWGFSLSTALVWSLLIVGLIFLRLTNFASAQQDGEK